MKRDVAFCAVLSFLLLIVAGVGVLWAPAATEGFAPGLEADRPDVSSQDLPGQANDLSREALQRLQPRFEPQPDQEQLVVGYLAAVDAGPRRPADAEVGLMGVQVGRDVLAPGVNDLLIRQVRHLV